MQNRTADTKSPDARADSLAAAREKVASLLGREAAGRLRAFRNGELYIDGPPGRSFLAWLIDFALIVIGSVLAAVAVYAGSSSSDPAPAAVGAAVAALLVLPLLYGWCYRNGKALGGRLTDTRLVRTRDGGRIGWGKAGWAMLIRTMILPLLIWGLLEAGSSDFSTVRTSIDDGTTERLRAAGFIRL